MKKRVLSALLAPMLLFTMAAPGMAAEGGDSAQRLAAVTTKVKSALGLDTQRYKDFNGQLTEGELAPTWRLSWSGEDGSLEITAAESGKILSFYRYSDDESRDDAPLSLPKRGPARAKALLKHFRTVSAVGEASLAELEAAPGMTKPAAKKVYDSFHETADAPESLNDNQSNQ